MAPGTKVSSLRHQPEAAEQAEWAMAMLAELTVMVMAMAATAHLGKARATTRCEC